MELTADDDPIEGATRREIIFGLVRLLAGFGALLAIVAFLGWAYRDELERFGGWFVGRFGIAGMAAGAFLADGLHFPLPPQFYLLTGIAGGVDTSSALLSVLVGSVLGGLTVFTFAHRASRIAFFAKRFAMTRDVIQRLVRRYGTWGIVLAGMLPVSYFVLCALGGMMRLRYRDYGVLAIMRIPRLVLSYLLIVLAWGV